MARIMENYMNKKIISAANQETYIFLPEGFNKVLLNLSGGTDSAMLLWQLLQYLREEDVVLDEIRALSGVDLYRPTSEWNASEIFLAIKEQFPEQNLTHEIFRYWKQGEKKKYHIKHESKLREDEKFYALFHGRTANPPKEEQKKISGMWEDISRPSEREIEVVKESNVQYVKNKITYYNSVPWNAVDKKFIAELYRKNSFMKEEVFPLTASCISGNYIATDYWTKPCKECWWCKEKKWAFNAYDGETLE